jgi:serine/threonine-protein kinase
MGAVFAVRHELTRHRRALKLLHPDRDTRPDLVRRFLAEASAAGRAGSPHLVETFDAGTLPSGAPYLVMELLTGLDLRSLMEREGHLAPGLACELVAQAAEGMAAAHRVGIIHRDLKPENLFVVDRPEGPFVKVLDFGISKFTTESVMQTGTTQDGALYGTPAYMAPEQFRNARDADARADVFALGAVLFECLSGQTPFEAPSIPAIGARIIVGESTALAALCPALDPALAALVEQAIAYDPALRIASARQLVERLQPFRVAAAGLPLALSVAMPSAAAELDPELAPFGKRARVALGVALVCALGLALLLVRQLSGTQTDAGATLSPVPAPVRLDSAHRAEERAHKPALVGAESAGPRIPLDDHSSALRARSRASKRELSSGSAQSDAEIPRSRAKELGLSERNPFR